MKRIAPLLIVVSVSACETPPSVYIYKPNTTVAQKDQDEFECELKASQAVPTDTQFGTTPTYTTPIQTNCYGYGYSASCTTTGGHVYGGQSYSYDANSDLRAEYWARCMVSKGYGGSELPVCPASKLPENATELLRSKLRAPREDACQVKITDRSTNLLYSSELKK